MAPCSLLTRAIPRVGGTRTRLGLPASPASLGRPASQGSRSRWFHPPHHSARTTPEVMGDHGASSHFQPRQASSLYLEWRRCHKTSAALPRSARLRWIRSSAQPVAMWLCRGRGTHYRNGSRRPTTHQCGTRRHSRLQGRSTRRCRHPHRVRQRLAPSTLSKGSRLEGSLRACRSNQRHKGQSASSRHR